MSSSGFTPHDHDRCIASALDAAQTRAERDGLRMTPIRRRVLEILLEEHRALGAYDLLDRLQGEGFSAQPPVAYRALDFLTANGMVHRIERLNAYIACATPDHPHLAVFMICRACDAVAESAGEPVGAEISQAATAAGFTIETCAIEAQGLCEACRAAEPAPA